MAKEPAAETERIITEKFTRIGIKIDDIDACEEFRDVVRHVRERMVMRKTNKDRIRAGVASLIGGFFAIIVAWLLNPAGGKLWQVLPLLTK